MHTTRQLGCALACDALANPGLPILTCCDCVLYMIWWFDHAFVYRQVAFKKCYILPAHMYAELARCEPRGFLQLLPAPSESPPGRARSASPLMSADDHEAISQAIIRRTGVDSSQLSADIGPAASSTAEWEATAKRELHWFHPELQAWLRQVVPGRWTGWYAANASSIEMEWPPKSDWCPWSAAVDATEAPYVRWFCGGETNAAFNEVDRHVLAGHGSETAFIAEPDIGEPRSLSRRQLLLDSTLAAHALREGLGLPSGRLVLFHLPNGFDAVIWIEAAKRVGAPYVAVAAGTSSAALSSRLSDTRAAVLVVSGGLLKTAKDAVATLASPPSLVVLDGLVEPVAGYHDGSSLLQAARQTLSWSVAEPDALSDEQLTRALWQLVTPKPVESSWPLFVLYTSGSTGKPKGIVHTHGGYQVGLCATSRRVLDVRPGSDTWCVVATPGWITGQSYMISAALLCRAVSVLLDGSPSSPPDRVAAVLVRHGGTVLKAGSTFLRMLMASPDAETSLARHDLTRLRLGVFCAEPVNETVHRFAAANLTRNYINCYWATEHGGIVWGRCHDADGSQPLRPDARSWPLPWVDADVMIAEHEGSSWRRTADGEQGEVVIRRQYPYMALTVWREESFGGAAWRGDVARWGAYFEAGVGYVQGDAAVRHSGGAYTFHGRSDEVINVGGNRIGTEEIENCLLLDRELPGSPLRNCVVVGMDDPVLGTVPCAFVVLQSGMGSLRAEDEGRLRQLVQTRHSSAAVPARFVVASSLPETYSGKYMRRLLRAMLHGAELGDIAALRNPECVPPLRAAITAGGKSIPGAESAASLQSAPMSAPSKAQLLKTVLGIVRRLAGNESIGPSTPFFDAGIDSLSASYLASELQAATGVKVASTFVFETGNSEAAAVNIHRKLAGQQEIQMPTVASIATLQSKLSVGVVSLASRWPGDCSLAGDLLLVLQASGNAVREVPASRWVLSAASEHGVDASTLTEAQQECAEHGGFLRGAEGFDVRFFGVSEAEAIETDPQQRLLLELSYEALHGSGARRASLLNCDCGVWLGIERPDWALLQAMAPFQTRQSVYAATGDTISVAGGRLSFVLGLQGPCISIDTACSSALVALHGAWASIRAGECRSGTSSAVSLKLSPRPTLVMAAAGMLSRDGRCKTFDATANGYVRSEGIGCAALSASGEGLPIGGVAVRQDGRSASLTAPNGSAQCSLLRATVAVAGLADSGTGVVEAHGTGTALGDPTESGSLCAATAGSNTRTVVSASKASMGHSEGPSGQVGLLRAVEGMRQRCSPGNAQLRVLNPLIRDRAEGSLMLPSQPSQTSHTGVGISSFGYSGTIAHAVIAEQTGVAATQPLRQSKLRLKRNVVKGPRRGDRLKQHPFISSMTPFLGTISQSSEAELVWEQHFSEFEIAFLQGHRVGKVKLIPGTCYIEMARAVVREQHGRTGFALLNVDFQTIMFLDELELRGAPTVRLRLQRACSQLAITSRLQDGTWDTNATMNIELRRATDESYLDLSAIRSRLPERVGGETFYANTGNDYQGEFRALAELWGGGATGEALGRVEYAHAERKHVHLRSCAWLDACSHASVWWSDHQGRPYYASSVRDYRVLKMDSVGNQQAWGHLTRNIEAHEYDLGYCDSSGSALVRIDGFRPGLFESGWLERRRAQRHMYEVRWERADSTQSPCTTVALLGGMEMPSHAAQRRQHDAVLQTNLVFAADSLHPLPSLHAALTLLRGRTTSCRISLLSAAGGGIDGLARTTRLEAPTLPISFVEGQWSRKLWEVVGAVTAPEPELAIRQGRLKVPRLSTASLAAHGAVELHLRSRGAISNLSLQAQLPSGHPPQRHEAEVSVFAVGLNFRDVLNVLGEYPGDPGPPGDDCSGKIASTGSSVTHVSPSDPVLGIGHGSLASTTRAPALLFVPKPAALTFEGACTLPVTWSTVHVVLGQSLHCRRQRSVLHAATGGVGLAAIEYVHWLGGDVLATAGRPEKHRLLRTLGIGPLCSSRDGSAFARAAACLLGGARIHLVLNSLSSDFPSASVALLGEAGRFEEIGKRNVWAKHRMHASVGGTVTYDIIAIDSATKQDPAWMQTVLRRLASRAACGVLHGLPMHTFELRRQLEAAFRLLQSGRNVGKVVVRVQTPQERPVSGAFGHMLSGGTGGLGLLTARWLSGHGATTLTLASRSGMLAHGTTTEWAQLAASTAAVFIARCDVSEPTDVSWLMGAVRVHQRLQGIWHAAGVLADGLFSRLTAAMLRHVYGPKAHAAWSMQRGSAELPLRVCTLFSSVTALMGNGGQANYGAANSCLDALARLRRGAGVTGVSVQWGPWAQLGMASGGGVNARLKAQGLGLIELAQGLAALEAAVGAGGPSVVAMMPVSWGRMLGGGSAIPAFLSSFALLQRSAAPAAASTLTVMAASVGLDAVMTLVQRTAGGSVDADAPLMSAGLDSLGAVELRNGLQMAVGEGVTLPSTLVFDHPTARQLATFLAAAHKPEPLRRPSAAAPVQSADRRAVELRSMSVLLPGGVDYDGKAWQMAATGSDTVSEVPVRRWQINEDHPTGDSTELRVRHGGFLLGADRFDHGFFAISVAEASSMDPQQRLLLEQGYLALHGAGMRRDRLEGSLTGVFLGIAADDWPTVQALSMAGRTVFAATSSRHSVAAGRLSFVLGLQGPCVSYDTACSAALAAGHAALRAVQLRECEVGLLEGVNLMLLPKVSFDFALAGMTSVRGRSHTFDRRADGYARGEACGGVVLQPAADGAGVQTVEGAAVRQDGRSASLTAPNGQAQQALLLAALADAGVEAAALVRMEAHGTGTALGDPIEVGSLAGTLLPEVAPIGRAAIALGSVKANSGHAEPAAGMAGLTLLAVGLSRSAVPPNAQLHVINPHVGASLRGVVCALPTGVAETGAGSGGVSSFGFSGTIVHMVLKDSDIGRISRPTGPLVKFRRHRFTWSTETSPSPARPGTVTLTAMSASSLEILVLSVARDLTGGGTIEGSTVLSDAGIDSLSATELASKLSSSTGTSVSPALLTDHPTARAISLHLVEMLKEAHSKREAASRKGQGDQPLTSPRRRCLMLHGRASSSDLQRTIFEATGWLNGVDLEFIFVNGPERMPAQPELFESMYAAGLYTEREYFGWLLDPGGTDPSDVSTSLGHVQGILELHAPIHGIAGICDGSIIAALVASSNPGLFYLNFCGGPPGLFLCRGGGRVAVEAPSLHLLGSEDELFSPDQLRQIPEASSTAIVHTHSHGHVVPPLGSELERLVSTFLETLSDAARMQSNTDSLATQGAGRKGGPARLAIVVQKGTPDEINCQREADGRAADGDEVWRDSFSTLQRLGNQHASPQDLAIANLLGFLTILIGLTHWKLASPSPSGALKWAIVDKSDTLGYSNKYMYLPLDDIVMFIGSESGLQGVMTLFVVLSAVQDRRHRFSWRIGRRGVLACLLTVYLLFCTSLPTWLARVYVLLWPRSPGCKGDACRGPQPCGLIRHGNMWFLVDLAIIKILAFSMTALFGPRSLVPTMIALALHFSSFAETLPWPLVRHPLQKGMVASLWLPSTLHHVMSDLPMYFLCAVSFPLAFPAALPVERLMPRLLRVTQAWLFSTRPMRTILRHGGTRVLHLTPSITTASQACTRLLWLFSPRLLALVASPILRLFMPAWKPDHRAVSLPYILLHCPLQGTRSLTECGRKLLFNANVCMWNQWSTLAMAQDIFGLAILLCTMCAWAAITPRWRIPFVTTVGEHSFACYVASHTLVLFFAPIFEGVVTILLRLGLIPMEPVVQMCRFSLVLLSLMTLAFWSFASSIGPVTSAFTRHGTRLLGHLHTAFLAEARGLWPPKTPLQRRIAYALVIVLLAAAYDGSPAACESSKYKQYIDRPQLPTCEFVRKDGGAWAVVRASTVSRPLVTYASLGASVPLAKRNVTSPLKGKRRGGEISKGGRAGRGGMGKSQGRGIGKAGGGRSPSPSANAKMIGKRMNRAKAGGRGVARRGGRGMFGAGRGRGLPKPTPDLLIASSVMSCCDGRNARSHPAKNWRDWAARDRKNFCSHAWFTKHCVTAPMACGSSLWDETCSGVFCGSFEGTGGGGPCQLQASRVCNTCRACYERGCPLVA